MKRGINRAMYKPFGYITNNLKIRTKIFIFLIVSLLFFATILGISIYKRIETVLNEEYGDSMMQVIAQVNNNINFNLNKFEVSLKSFYAGDRFKSIIPDVINDYNDMLLYFESVKEQISAFQKIDEDIEELEIYSFDENIPWDNNSIYSAGEIINEEWVGALLRQKRPNFFYWTNKTDDAYVFPQRMDILSCYTPVFNSINNKPLAILRLDVSTKTIFGSIDSVTFGDTGIVFVAEDIDNLIYFDSNRKQHLENYESKIAEVIRKNDRKGQFIINTNDEHEFIVYSRDNRLGWYVIGIMPLREFGEKAKNVRNFIFTLLLILYAIGFIITFFFAKLITKRITLLMKQIDNGVDSNFKTNVEIYGNDEIGQASRHFQKMMEKVKALIDEIEEQYKKQNLLLNEKHELEVLKKEAELCALQNQINPHFLYNTLEMIKGLLFSENPQKNIIKAIRALSDVFRHNLSTKYTVTIQDEIKHIENYLTIHNLRFSGGVDLVNKVEKCALNSHIIRFTFEPIIENAIIHGFRGKKSDNKIYIFTKTFDRQLTIYIKDNGIGIRETDLDRIRRLLSSGECSLQPERQGGVGIYNVNSRIKKYYGMQYGIDIESKLGVGTTVIINLPRCNRDNITF